MESSSPNTDHLHCPAHHCPSTVETWHTTLPGSLWSTYIGSPLLNCIDVVMTTLPGSLWSRSLWCWLITNYGGEVTDVATIPLDKCASTWTIECLKGLSAFSIVSESLKANSMKRFTNSLRHVYHNPQGTPGHVLCLWLFSPGIGKDFTWDWKCWGGRNSRHHCLRDRLYQESCKTLRDILTANLV